MNQLQAYIKNENTAALFENTSIGIEKEGHRVTPEGQIAQTPHPQRVDGSSENQYIQRDFAESQTELVSPPVIGREEGVLQWMHAIYDVTIRHLDNEEAIWPYSMPPQLPSDDQIKVAQLDDPAAVDYREYLVGAYGKKLQMISGLHYNFGLDPDFIKGFYQAGYSDYDNLFDTQNALYLKLARNFLRYQWVIVYFLGASPYAHDSFFEPGVEPVGHPVRSIRNSEHGYVNHEDVHVSYHDLETYITTLENNVKTGHLIAEKEFYSNVRLRGGAKVRDLLHTGIKYLEVRNTDIQGDAPYGIQLRELVFIKYFLLYLLWIDEMADDPEIEEGVKIKTQVANEDPFSQTVYYEEGQRIVKGLREMLTDLAVSQDKVDLIEEILHRLEAPEETPAARIVTAYPTVEDWLASGLAIAKKNRKNALKAPYQLGGFTDMELSTQIFIADAIRSGIQVEILDRTDNLLRLSVGDHIEYVKNGNITSKDTYISHYLLANKEVTKQIIQEAGFQAPQSRTYYSLSEVEAAAGFYLDRPLVVKPKSTNMGIGISIFKQGPSREELLEACRIAFEADDSVLLEDYVPGVEYRFFVLDGKTIAVLLRVPANVVGNGKATIAQLVAEKNKYPKRGLDHRTPLEKIQLGDIEALNLKQQDLTFDSVLEEGQKAYLRENSNISTGGDSIDVTDQVHPSYLDIASQMAQALGVNITGIDLMIQDITKAAQVSEKGANYGFIEANFNPMMMMHVYPAQGQGVRVTEALLHYLFPEKGFLK
ncbi:bifunctional glutamate--cysteine ligase GshA/glutathione synthetase GshB [Aerococcus loyolae]|uniref:bifunctional glutamate--cysteine ligase GshA/glutathione synthetase GshB n=1 Tax=Aerococcus loyolae TaxID=2976809 RepID=UPI00124463DE|nr:bifunctional glutamate--cysteine ligase GshA/glutathione synthetase GshB [Aerococcus loyolae]KAA9218150.1 bifunctional glutamate--cysteine ligase GshA/glutathione synthetase GshB [Aerococcus loyolae]